MLLRKHFSLRRLSQDGRSFGEECQFALTDMRLAGFDTKPAIRNNFEKLIKTYQIRAGVLTWKQKFARVAVNQVGFKLFIKSL